MYGFSVYGFPLRGYCPYGEVEKQLIYSLSAVCRGRNIGIWAAFTKHATGQKASDFRPLNVHKNRRHPTEVECHLFVVQSCLTDANFAISSNYCLIGTRVIPCFFSFYFFINPYVRNLLDHSKQDLEQQPLRFPIEEVFLRPSQRCLPYLHHCYDCLW